MSSQIVVHPVQTPGSYRNAKCPQIVTLKAYEVYKAVYGEQVAMITGECRGGFSTGELIAFLYAHNFPKDEWPRRVDEALYGMENL